MINTKRGRKKPPNIFKHLAVLLGLTKCTFAKLKDNLGEKMFSQTIEDFRTTLSFSCLRRYLSPQTLSVILLKKKKQEQKSLK